MNAIKRTNYFITPQLEVGTCFSITAKKKSLPILMPAKYAVQISC